MKKTLKTIIAAIMTVVMLVPTAMAANETTPQWEDVFMSEAEANAILADSTIYTNTDERASNLISAYAIVVSKVDSTTLRITAKTTGTTEVVKCGFKEIVVQRRANSSSSWTDYATYEDIYIEQVAYTIGKSVTVQPGYQYRATCVHYAKKNIFSVQKIDNVSNTVTF